MWNDNWPYSYPLPMKIDIWYFWNVWNTFHKGILRSQETKTLVEFEINFVFVIYWDDLIGTWYFWAWISERSKKAGKTKLVSRVYWEKLNWSTKLKAIVQWWLRCHQTFINYLIYNSPDMGTWKPCQKVYQEKFKWVLYWVIVTS